MNTGVSRGVQMERAPRGSGAKTAKSACFELIEGRSRASYGLTRPDFVHHFSPRKPAL